MKPLVVEDDADAELRAAIIRYEEERPGLGAQLWDEIQRTLALIQERPGIGERVRRARVKGIARRFPVRSLPIFRDLSRTAGVDRNHRLRSSPAAPRLLARSRPLTICRLPARVRPGDGEFMSNGSACPRPSATA